MNDYEQLLKKYNDLLNENKHLKEEIDSLRLKLSNNIVEKTNNIQLTKDIVINEDTVNQNSPAYKKIELFKSLFKGRSDVYAKRWYSKTTEKSGYQPVCENEWILNLCNKRKYKCSDCPNRKLIALTDKELILHLSGKDPFCRDVIGIYPLLTDNTCSFLAADFDKENFQEDVKSYKQICDSWHIPAYIERSRSGNGAHAWIFFNEPVSATIARKLGDIILTNAMNLRGELSFSSYDRLFPNQDTMPSGGFGNLIALPLQGWARKVGNSVFVDDNFIPYPDQWALLSSIKKLSGEEVIAIINSHAKGSELGILISESDEKPWESKKTQVLTSSDFPNELTIVKSNLLYIPKKGLSDAAFNTLKRLAAFKNPDFYKAQAMRMNVYDKPRVIDCSYFDDKYLYLPRGTIEALTDILNNAKVKYQIIDYTNHGNDIPAAFNGKLRDEQDIAAKKMLAYDNGILQATTGFGKTVVAAYLIGARKVNTLILVHTQALLEQWKQALETFLDFDIEAPIITDGRKKKKWSPIGTLGAGTSSLTNLVDVAIIQSVITDGEVKELIKNYGMVIVDECHHISAVSFEKVLKEATAKYVYGLTATPTRQDGQHPIIFMQCGKIRYQVNAKKEAEQKQLDYHLIPRFTSFRTLKDKTINELYQDLCEDSIRNKLIVNDIFTSLKENRTPIVLTERREHVTILHDLLCEECPNIITLTGTNKKKKKREKLNQLINIKDDEPLIIIATGKYIGEGFDYPRLDTLFLTLPIAWQGKVAQYAGRLNREYQNKKAVEVFDYVDLHVPMLERMYQKRLKGYAAIGYKTKTDAKTSVETPNLIYDGKSFFQIFLKDLENAKRDILIISPFLNEIKVSEVVKLLMMKNINNLTVVVITKPINTIEEKNQDIFKQNLSLMKNAGIKIIHKDNFNHRFSVIDNHIVWYGNISFLSFNKQDENVMRFENDNIAGELIDLIKEE